MKLRQMKSAHPEEPVSLSNRRLEGSFETGLRLRSAPPQDERRPVRAGWLALPFLLVATPALAHAGHPDFGASFLGGLLHPLTGLDHLMTMLMVGLWSGIAFPRRWWVCPAAFMVFMLGGFAYGAAGGAMPLAEALILASLVGLGFALLLDARPALSLSAGIVALFAVAHGFAHGHELAWHDGTGFAAGFLIATAALHAAGAWLAFRGRRIGQATGAAAALLALALVMSP